MLPGMNSPRIAGLVALLLAALTLCACPLPPPVGCTPGATRCSPQGKPERCSDGQRWWAPPTSPACTTLGTVCCMGVSPYGAVVAACLPQSACVALADASTGDAAGE